jgi:hypothetical protein
MLTTATRILLLMSMAPGACDTKSSSDSSSAGQSSDDSVVVPTASDCAAFAPCGGRLLGKWRLRASCVGAAFNDPACAGYASNQSVSGVASYEFQSDGVLSYQGSVSIAYAITVSEACAEAIAHKDAAGYCKLVQESMDDNPNVPASISCDASGGTCVCQVVQGPISSGADAAYTASGSSLTIVEGGNVDALSYCVKGDVLTLGSADGLPISVFSRE